MRVLIAFLLLLCSFVTQPVAQKKDPDRMLRSLVEAERAFSRMSEEKGIRESFSQFIAADGILFRPTAVLGKKWMQEHPLPPSQTRPLLTWQPIYAGISRAGDMGYTTGPWQYKNDVKDGKPSAFGSFMTVWKKQADGTWKFAIDLGITNPEPKTVTSLTYAGSGTGSFKRIDVATTRNVLLKAEREFSKASAKRGAVTAFLEYAAKDVQLFRNNKFPFTGRKSAATALSPLSIEWTWTPAFADVSISGDLGYSHGSYELRDKSSRVVSERGNYMRVWKKVRGAWKLLIDVADPLPPEKKN